MADGYVQVPPDSDGKKIDASELLTTVGTVERQRVSIPDEVQISGDELAAILIEQRTQNLILLEGLGVHIDLDDLRDSVSGEALNVDFIDLKDAPSSYFGFAGYHLAVNSAATAVEFVFAREDLTAPRSYFVRSTGSNSNNGRTAASAWLTIDYAMANLANIIDFGGQAVTLDIGPGTFDGTNIVAAFVGGGSLAIQGAGSGSTTIASSASLACIEIDASQLTIINLTGFTMVDANGWGCLSVNASVVINQGADIVYGVSTFSHIATSAPGAYVNINNAYSITAAATNSHLQNFCAGARIVVRNAVGTLSGTQTYTAFCDNSGPGEIKTTGAAAYSGGTIHGQRYSATLNGIINTQGGGVNFFPGDVAGTTATGGQYA